MRAAASANFTFGRFILVADEWRRPQGAITA